MVDLILYPSCQFLWFVEWCYRFCLQKESADFVNYLLLIPPKFYIVTSYKHRYRYTPQEPCTLEFQPRFQHSIGPEHSCSEV